MPAATAFLMASPMAPVLGSVTAMPSGFLSMAAWMSWACLVASGSFVYWKSTPSLAAAASAPLRMRSQNVSPGAWWVTMMIVIVFSAAAAPPPEADDSALPPPLHAARTIVAEAATAVAAIAFRNRL